MSQSWLIIERIENWEADKANGFSFFGLPKRLGKSAGEIKKDDRLYCYVSRGVSAFSDIRVVIQPSKRGRIEPRYEIYDTNYAFYFDTNPVLVLALENWIPIKGLIPILELTRGRTVWSPLFQTSIRKLSFADAKILDASFERAAKGDSRAL
jgi:hypothetical protein